jgi:hypothetical protein
LDRSHKLLVVLSLPLFLVAATAAPSFFPSRGGLCFSNGSATYRVSPGAAVADYRIKIDNAAERPDLRMQLVDRPETADFVFADEIGAPEGGACRSAVGIKTVKLDSGGAPDVTVAITTAHAAPDYRIFVHSARHSHQDAAALLAAMWKAARERETAGSR